MPDWTGSALANHETVCGHKHHQSVSTLFQCSRHTTAPEHLAKMHNAYINSIIGISTQSAAKQWVSSNVMLHQSQRWVSQTPNTTSSNPSLDHTFQPCSFANCSQAYSMLVETLSMSDRPRRTLAGLPTFCPMVFHLLFS